MLVVVVPEIVLAKRWQEPFHNHRARFVRRLFEHEPRVMVSSVPFTLDRKDPLPAEAGSGGGRVPSATKESAGDAPLPEGRGPQ